MIFIRYFHIIQYHILYIFYNFNIFTGAMISQHFSQSQFLIISLKDGMFNNANVLFKTSFVDGLSKVDRMVLKNKEKLKIKTQSENEEKENVFKDKKNKMVLEGK